MDMGGNFFWINTQMWNRRIIGYAQTEFASARLLSGMSVLIVYT